MRRARTIATVLAWTLFGTFAGLAASVALPTLAGWRAHTVLSGSMSPAVHTGDLVMTEQISPSQARAGDIVTFPDPNRNGKIIMHRVQRIGVTPRIAHVVTKGDANTAVERWDVPAADHIGRLVYRVPKAGFLAIRLSQRIALILLLVLPAGLLAVLEIVRIWRPTAAGGAGGREATAA